MGENAGSAGLSRRDLLKRSAVAGGLVWVAPTVLTSTAGASTTLATCPASSRFALKHDTNQRCSTPGTNPSTGNCAASGGFTAFRDGCCLQAAGLIVFSESANDQTHTYVLANGVALAGAFGKCANDCFSHQNPHNTVVSDVTDPVTGRTTVTITCSNLSHSEIVVCYTGTAAPNCP